MQEGQCRQKHPECVSQKISKGQAFWAFMFLTSFLFCVFVVKSHMPVARQGGGLEGNEICLGSQSGGGEAGMSTFIN